MLRDHPGRGSYILSLEILHLKNSLVAQLVTRPDERVDPFGRGALALFKELVIGRWVDETEAKANSLVAQLVRALH